MMHENFSNQIFDGNPITINIELKRSISIIECQFLNIRESNAIFVDRDTISMYITSSLFISCITEKNGVVLLSRARCLTMTHVCTYDCGSYTNSGFLNYDCRDIDFSYCLYNTFSRSISDVTDDDSFNILVRSGSQFYRCNNLTETTKGGFHFSAPDCFSFSMTTIKSSGCCFQFSGYAPDQKAKDKTIEMVNFFTNYEYLLKLSGESPFKLTIINSVLLNDHSDAQLFHKGNFFVITVEIKNCIVSEKYGNDPDVLSFIDCTRVAYDITHLMIMPHYTYDTVCDGPNVENSLSAKDCNAGNCIDTLCNKSIGFPEDVIPYTTIAHLDLQTATFTPSTKFSKSAKFSESSEFSESNKFSQSKKFLETDRFTESKKFSGSNKFSQSKKFLETDKFTESKKFSGSNKFSQSKKFPETDKFTESKKFSGSNKFSQSKKFLETDKFTESKKFSGSLKFTESKKFHATDKFSETLKFSKSDYFSKSSYLPSMTDVIITKSPEISSLEVKSTMKFTESDLFSLSETAFDINGGVNQDKTSKGSNKAMIGAIAGVAAAVVIAAIIVAVFLIRKHKRVHLTSDFDMMETNDSGITTDNVLKGVMEQDDPFAEEFEGNDPANGGIVI